MKMSGSMRRWINALIGGALVLLATPTSAAARARSTLTFENRSGEPALVKLVGPHPNTVEVPDAASRTVHVGGGRYHILVRYGAEPSQHRYTRGQSFKIVESKNRYSSARITLHRVVNGNYATSPSSRGEFEQAAVRGADK